ncbi:hypothetical protein BO94DRAFT_586911 [Aspergillus sclerotioniger CBS 115572]|uniref:Uncharacterized protein n=1 Tax=Aspergillus sclerotioniger CBS 115572 TaxID=1450535 RepID=A0A317WBI5_9EURO|nr:hypothetical protein BO94DRAFT_586911 [Aspergillus sclerotioniger CBS 115572]PWY83866.1 hypothetical protein BO94DRAFT_586911 [Aspergillus sclerotioniger CBS 115572]
MEVTKTSVFDSAPISADALGAFYVDALAEIQNTYTSKVPHLSSWWLSASDRTTIEKRKLGFANMVHAMSAQPRFAGMSLEVEVAFRISA